MQLLKLGSTWLKPEAIDLVEDLTNEASDPRYVLHLENDATVTLRGDADSLLAWLKSVEVLAERNPSQRKEYLMRAQESRESAKRNRTGRV